jgi:CubicO group peptidase (beta-lactamase class C family)
MIVQFQPVALFSPTGSSSVTRSTAVACSGLAICAVITLGVLGSRFERQRRVDAVFAAYDRKDSPGCALGVYRDGRIIYARGYGMADIQRAVPITSRTVFDIGSTSKQFTAASIILLAQQGKLTLDDDVRRHIPELPQYDRPITIRHLLHHTSGLRDYINVMVLCGANTQGHTTARQALDAIVRQKALNFEPGAEHLYSNSGYFLLSQIVERVSGKSLRAFAQEQIFAPLGMQSTHFHDDHRMEVANRATGYAPAASGFQVVMSNWEQTGDGAVHTSVEDLLRWDNNFYEPKVGGQALLTQLHATGKLNNGAPLDYASGLVLGNLGGLKVVSHGGAWAGYGAELIRFPEQRLSVATLCNFAAADPWALARAVAAIYLGDKLTPAEPYAAAPAASSVPATVSPADLAAWAATYREAATGTLRTVAVQGDRLLATFGQGREELIRRNASEFSVVVAGNTLRLVMERLPNGKRRMRQLVDGRETAVFDEVLFANPTAAELESHSGQYFSEELNATYEVAVEAGTLVLRGPLLQAFRLRPLEQYEFTSGAVTVRFMPDAKGRTDSFELSQGRVRGLRFVRK